jgi:hypothetical protein
MNLSGKKGIPRQIQDLSILHRMAHWARPLPTTFFYSEVHFSLFWGSFSNDREPMHSGSRQIVTGQANRFPCKGTKLFSISICQKQL